MTRLLAALFILSTLTPGAVAARCNGEFSAAIVECACSVLNRLNAGWSERRVLDAYHAPSVPATPDQVAAVAAVLDGRAACDGSLYFMYSRADIKALRLERFEPALTVRSGSKEVRFYPRWFRRVTK